MRKVVKLFLVALMALTLTACGESCEHVNKTTSYAEGGLLQIKKTVICDDCNSELEKENLSAVEYVYDKEIINTQDIKVVVNKLTVDAWGLMGLELTVTGTGKGKRTFETTEIFVNGVDSNGWIYANDLNNDKKAVETHHFSDKVPVEDFLKSQDYKVEIDYTIMNSSSYKTLKESSVSFNLNEFTAIKEVKE